MKSQKKYLKNYKKCPRCGSADIFGDPIEQLVGTFNAQQWAGCNKCGLEWRLHFELTLVHYDLGPGLELDHSGNLLHPFPE